jgi:UDP-N-acetylglucosamine 2-epimerase (non-hydrolysing)/GDP/UDP-N,N'-diacetylbacillosamine 2-epimerase (hydrolysing)
MDAVVGNSSSGLYEVPSFHKPTVNIGERQQSRLKASSVIDCQTHVDSILQAIKAAFELNCSDTVNPYGDGKSSERIIALLKGVPDYKILLMKRFFEMG